MPLAWIENGAVRDVCLAPDGGAGDPGKQYAPVFAALYDTEVPDGTVNGATLVEGVWTNPPPYVPPDAPPYVEPVPATITKLQLTLGMVTAGLISASEGESMAEGTGIPDAILNAINALPSEMRAPARIKFKGMTIVERASPLLAILMAQADPAISDAEMDAYFIDWAAIQ